MKKTLVQAPGVGAITTIAPGLIVAGTVMLFWPALFPTGLIFAGIAAVVASAVTSGGKSLLLFAVAAVAVHSMLVPLAAGIPSLNLAGFDQIDVSLPSVSVGGTEATTPAPEATDLPPTTAVPPTTDGLDQ